MNFNFDIISPKGKLFSGDVKQVTLPSSTGELTILARHMPFVCCINIGKVEVRTEKEILKYSIGKGFFSIEGNQSTLLVEDVLSTP